MNFAAAAFAGSLVWVVAVLVVLLAVAFVVAKAVGKWVVIDPVWGAMFCAVAVTSFLTSAGHGCTLRRVLLLVLVLVWGLRLTYFIARRSIGKGEDPRYAELMRKAKDHPNLYAARMIFGLQGLLAFVISAPIMVGAYEADRVGVLAWLGVAVWCVGLFFEAVGDHQMQRFRNDPANKGKLIQSGLWRYTRHPNYFGDACVWWGIFLVAADALPGVVTVFGPVIMTLLLTLGSGARTLERSMSKRDGWDDYAARTSMFFPLPPKKR